MFNCFACDIGGGAVVVGGVVAGVFEVQPDGEVFPVRLQHDAPNIGVLPQFAKASATLLKELGRHRIGFAVGKNDRSDQALDFHAQGLVGGHVG